MILFFVFYIKNVNKLFYFCNFSSNYYYILLEFTGKIKPKRSFKMNQPYLFDHDMENLDEEVHDQLWIKRQKNEKPPQGATLGG